MTARLVRIRLSGDDTDLRQLIDTFRQRVTVHEESAPYPNGRDPGVRRYLLIELADDASAEPSAEPPGEGR
ncbi:hypothetical protein [Actinomadura rupiterrae]|uniref:hypothetical protein n=1 Tax=Actinomadura rupiterrae TaxID=559627 RepID=UPI0020A5DE75|nr:hypothetical protein [Actinomadura rupiterrae]MCP2337902.1 hypothetical protein [Actinomadura rupiterrae]